MSSVVHLGKYFPPDSGGIESVTAIFAAGATAAGHQVTVVCFGKSSSGSSEVIDSARILRAPQTAFVSSQPLGWSYFLWAVREGRDSDLVHLHVPNMLAALAAILLGGRPKLLVHWHSDVVGKGLLGFLLRPLERAMLRRADRIVCTSQLYADGSNMLRPFLHKVSVVPNGIPDVAARPNMAGGMPEQLKYLIGGRRIILAVGRLVPYKGFGVLIEAALRLPQDAVVVIVGSGHLQEQLRGRIEQLGLRTKVLLTGHVEDSVLDALYRNAALFCLPSVERSEAFGVVIVEAMAYGLPVVATKIPGSGVPWVNMDQESGLNVPVNDPQQLAEACTSILRSPELRGRLSIGARQRYSELFTTAAVNARMLEEYARILCVH